MVDDVPDDIAEGEEAAVDGDPLLGSVSCSPSPETKNNYKFILSQGSYVDVLNSY
jgi:hypothetical protein